MDTDSSKELYKNVYNGFVELRMRILDRAANAANRAESAYTENYNLDSNNQAEQSVPTAANQTVENHNYLMETGYQAPTTQANSSVNQNSGSPNHYQSFDNNIISIVKVRQNIEAIHNEAGASGSSLPPDIYQGAN